MSDMSTRGYAAAHFAFELDDNKDIGFVKAIEGGGIKADVMTYQSGLHYDRWRQVGKPKFEDIKLSVGMDMSKPFYQWIESFFTGKPDRRSGALVAADFHYKERARREFSEALIKELTFPKLDASDKNAALMNVTLAVEHIEYKPGNGKVRVPTAYSREKVWTPSRFRFRIDSLERACERVTKIDSFTIKQNIIEYHSGLQRAPIKMPSQIEFPQLSFYVPEVDAAPFFERFKARGVGGQVGNNLTGALVSCDPEGKDLFTLTFTGADIISLQPDKSDASSEDIKLVKVDLYTESMKFEYKSGSQY